MRPHCVIDTFESLEAVMRWADPWRERGWEEASDADEDRVDVSARGARCHIPPIFIIDLFEIRG
jgi:hypothetical protein